MWPGILAESFINEHGREITALITVVLVIVAIIGVDRALRRLGRLDPSVATRLRFVRRLVEAAILVIGIAIAISQFTALDRLAASILASGAIAAAAVAFAARTVLGNVLAGVMLAITQPIRIGDLVTLEDDTGVVEDIKLTYTFLRTGSDARLIVPNEKIASSVLRNDSIITDTVALEVKLWLSHEADERRATEAIERAIEGARTSISEVTAEGVVMTVGAPPVRVGDRVKREAELRANALAVLREAGLR